MDLIGDIKLIYLIITFKQDIPQLPPCSFFFFLLSRFNQSAHLPCVPSHMDTATGGSKLSPQTFSSVYITSCASLALSRRLSALPAAS
jgi:hypothetical protein